MRKRYVMIGIIGILLLISGICYSCTYKREEPAVELISSLSDSEPESSPTVGVLSPGSTPTAGALSPELFEPEMAAHSYVHLCGEVIQPGVYQVSESARVIDLIELAGGLTEEAAGDYINQAQQVIDGQRIYIPSKDEVKDIPFLAEALQDVGDSETTSSSKKRININKADARELMELPGVGEAKAAAIIEYRTTNGSFETIEELMKISGIKEGLFNQVSSYITVK